MGMNNFCFTGYIGKDAEQRFTPGGDSIVTMSVPVTSGFGDKQKTSWIRCTLFGKRGESVLPYLKKGQLIGVSGEFSMNEWNDKDGMKKSSPEVRINDLQLLGKSDAPKPEQKTEQKPAKKASFDDFDSDSVPF